MNARVNIASAGIRDAHDYMSALIPLGESETVYRARELLVEMRRLEALKLEIIAHPKKYPFPAFRDTRDAYDACLQELADIKY